MEILCCVRNKKQFFQKLYLKEKYSFFFISRLLEEEFKFFVVCSPMLCFFVNCSWLDTCMKNYRKRIKEKNKIQNEFKSVWTREVGLTLSSEIETSLFDHCDGKFKLENEINFLWISKIRRERERERERENCLNNDHTQICS